MFSEFEALIQRLWWLLINEQRLTFDNIYSTSGETDIYSCTLDKFNTDDYKALFGYLTKVRSDDNELLEFDNFKTLYTALNNVRQIQGYGIFYGSNVADDITELTEQEYDTLEKYIKYEETPIIHTESQKKIALDGEYTVIKEKYHKKRN